MWWRGLSTAWKVLGAVATAIGVVWTAALAYAAKSAEYATDAELQHEVVRLDSRIDGLTKREDVDRLAGALRMEAAERDKSQHKALVDVFEMLVSGHAADLEPDRRRKAEASAFARTKYRDALKSGDEPAEAAAYARDQRPPWRR